MSNVFDLMNEIAAQQRQREFEQRAHAMPDWEKQFLLGFLQYTDAHPEVLQPACPPTYQLVAIPGMELGACPFCHEPAHAKMCQPLALLMQNSLTE